MFDMDLSSLMNMFGSFESDPNTWITVAHMLGLFALVEKYAGKHLRAFFSRQDTRMVLRMLDALEDGRLDPAEVMDVIKGD